VNLDSKREKNVAKIEELKIPWRELRPGEFIHRWVTNSSSKRTE
jgi:hypothetical protein